jgi:uncharacterized membrane protein
MLDRYKIGLLIGALCLLAAIILGMAFPSINGILAITLFTIGLVMLVISLYYSIRHSSEVRQDERTKRLSGEAMGYAWLLTLVVIFLLSFGDLTGYLKITAAQAMMAIMITMSVFTIIFQWYLGVKGD